MKRLKRRRVRSSRSSLQMGYYNSTNTVEIESAGLITVWVHSNGSVYGCAARREGTARAAALSGRKECVFGFFHAVPGWGKKSLPGRELAHPSHGVVGHRPLRRLGVVRAAP